MVKEFHQTVWDDRLDEDLRAILALAIREDLGTLGDWTTKALVDENAVGRAASWPGSRASWPDCRASN